MYLRPQKENKKRNKKKRKYNLASQFASFRKKKQVLGNIHKLTPCLLK